MDKNSIIGFVLIGVVLIGFSWYSQPSQEEQRAQFVKDSTAQANRAKAEKAAKAAAFKKKQETQQKIQEDTTALFYTALTGQAREITLHNDKVELTFSTKGAQVKKAVVKNYRDNITGGKGVVLFQGNDQSLSYTLAGKDFNISTADLYFQPSAVSDTTITFTAQAATGKTISLVYRLGHDYMLHLALQADGMEGLFAPNTNTMAINWQDKVRQQEKGFNFENRYATLTYHESEGGTDYLSETSEKIDKDIEENIDWVAFKNQFFSAVMIAKKDLGDHALLTSIPLQKETGYLKQYEAKMKSFFDPSGKVPSEFDFYYGPNDFRLLQKVEKENAFGKDLQMQRLVYLGWPLFRYINRWFTIYVFDWLSKWFPMGVVLILITLLLKAITYPMVKKSYMSSAKMRVLKPKLDAATRQYDKPEDQMQKQQAMMAEYAKYGVSPLSGCLPMLIQMPIWIAMFNFVPNAIQLRGQSFLWMHDLSTYDPIFQWNANIWLIGDHLSLTCVLFCAAQIIYSWFTMQMQKDQMVGQQAEQMKMMQWMMYLMPLMFFFIFNDYSSGLNFYYFISLIMSAGIMYALRKTTNEEKLLAILESRYKENQNNPKKMKGMMARMQALQQMQQQQMEEQRRKQDEMNRKKKGL
ncbi:membrane protein insertase, YidC/Oxa1 family, N-terminal domain protein [Prevotella dentalis DSM 3688]|uniref:Membrane protein insertase YidC n=1 Tax=Prevotella dentalis (strain ATCC 49559 / DSM 3688 / JCM 13448 / NCTC 12043 / ES 2772) TaxID=908937 RepID=F9D095_PREDD|nr:membrane protein insertase YidC [Prevotella dentalis]AGB27869.1 membrane protein insertase, YidC/Oxa1 family, N-terminal domain protein [Prevotella dentalis DSM 3688]EGQ17188.1 inner membrane protein OxaA [Prevotella dentalis DSM 3688]